MTAPRALDQALNRLRCVLGDAQVRVDANRLAQVNAATLEAQARLVAEVCPADHDEVVATVRIANEFGIALHPVSRGCNWGYGSRIPPRDGSVLLSLARLDRIVELDEDLAYVTLEPGVSFGGLLERLRRTELLPPTTGTTPAASVVANVLSRGIGTGLYENQGAHGGGYRVVLPNGETFDAARSGELAKLGRVEMGPSVQGLFDQSRFGVVTRMSIRLHRAPTFRQRFMFRMTTTGQLAESIDALRPLLQRRTREIQVSILSVHRLASQLSGFPFSAADPNEALEFEALELPDALADQRWLASATVWAETDAELALRVQALNEALPRGAALRTLAPPAPGRDVELSSDNLRGAYWRKHEGMPPDPHPDRDRCGVIWISPVMPMVGNQVATSLLEVEALLTANGFEPMISLRALDGRTLTAVIGLIYDRDRRGDDTRAARVGQRLHRRLRDMGLSPYRSSPLADPSSNSGRDSLLEAIHDAIDPMGIFRP